MLNPPWPASRVDRDQQSASGQGGRAGCRVPRHDRAGHGTNIAGLCLDAELRLRKSSVPAAELLNLRQSDIGRSWSSFERKWAHDRFPSRAHPREARFAHRNRAHRAWCSGISRTLTKRAASAALGGFGWLVLQRGPNRRPLIYAGRRRGQRAGRSSACRTRLTCHDVVAFRGASRHTMLHENS